jgi:hypothetical protein
MSLRKKENYNRKERRRDIKCNIEVPIREIM